MIKRYTQKDLANKVGLTLKEIHEYEIGYTAISFDKLYQIAEGLSVNIKVLLPKTRESKKLLSLMDQYREQESLDALVKSLSEDMKSGKEKVKKAEKRECSKIQRVFLRFFLCIHMSFFACESNFFKSSMDRWDTNIAPKLSHFRYHHIF